MKKSIGPFALLIVLICLTGVTAAYFVYGRDIKNVFTVGQNSIEIEEDYRPLGELDIGENVFKKRVEVKNTGSIPCFVRVFAAFSDSRISDIAEISPDGKEYFPAAEYPYHLRDGWEYIDEEDELLGPYYYYTKELGPNETSPPLFDSVKIIIEEAEQIRDFEIIIYAESVQTLDRYGNEFSGSLAWQEAWSEFLLRR